MKKLKFKNASILPRRYYGLHMIEGLAEYKDIQHDGKEPFRIYLSENVIKKMDASFTGRPVFAEHVDSVNLENIEHEADGWVVKSFYNPPDGKHWVEFMVTSDRGHEAISKGWKLSNAYLPKQFGNEGVWHAIPYAKEVLDAEYEHLAIVPNPRYQESVILTPEEFKTYNEQKEKELVSLQNSLTEELAKPTTQKSKGVKMGFKFWNKAEAENHDQVAQLSVTLPRCGRELTIAQLVNELDEAEMKKAKENDDDKDPKAKKDNDDDSDIMNDDSMVDMGDGSEKMKLGDLKKKYNEMCEAAKKANAEPLGKGGSPLATPGSQQGTPTQNSLEKLKNADQGIFQNEAHVQTIPFDSLSSGRSKYGSAK